MKWHEQTHSPKKQQMVPTPVALQRVFSWVPTCIALRQVTFFWFRFGHTQVWVWAPFATWIFQRGGAPQTTCLKEETTHNSAQRNCYVTPTFLRVRTTSGGHATTCGLRVPNPNSRGHATKRGLRVPDPNSRGHATKRGFRVPNPNSRGHATNRGLRFPNPNSRGHATKHGLRVPDPNSRGHATKRGLRVPDPNSRGHATKHGLRVPNPNSRGYATKRGLRVPDPNSRGHATKRGLDNWPGFLNSTAFPKGNKITIGCLRPAFSGAQKWAQVLHQVRVIPPPLYKLRGSPKLIRSLGLLYLGQGHRHPVSKREDCMVS